MRVGAGSVETTDAMERASQAAAQLPGGGSASASLLGLRSPTRGRPKGGEDGREQNVGAHGGDHTQPQTQQQHQLGPFSAFPRLRSLVLSHNQVRLWSPTCFSGIEHTLEELYIERNRLRSLLPLQPLKKLRRLNMAFNRVSDFNELRLLAAERSPIPETLEEVVLSRDSLGICAQRALCLRIL